jgi:hypothetical protein
VDLPLAVAISAVAAMVLVRVLAARGIAAGRGRFFWLLFAPKLILGVAIVVVSARFLATVPVLGLLVGAVGVLWLALLARSAAGMSRAVSGARHGGDPISAMFEPCADHMATFTVIFLIVSIAGGVGMIVWAVTR